MKDKLLFLKKLRDIIHNTLNLAKTIIELLKLLLMQVLIENLDYTINLSNSVPDNGGNISVNVLILINTKDLLSNILLQCNKFRLQLIGSVSSKISLMMKLATDSRGILLSKSGQINYDNISSNMDLLKLSELVSDTITKGGALMKYNYLTRINKI